MSQVAKAAQHYAQAKNYKELVECYALLEDYSSLEKLIGQLTEGFGARGLLLHESSVGTDVEALVEPWFCSHNPYIHMASCDVPRVPQRMFGDCVVLVGGTESVRGKGPKRLERLGPTSA